jgi:hypothetical protein
MILFVKQDMIRVKRSKRIVAIRHRAVREDYDAMVQEGG